LTSSGGSGEAVFEGALQLLSIFTDANSKFEELSQSIRTRVASNFRETLFTNRGSTFDKHSLIEANVHKFPSIEIAEKTFDLMESLEVDRNFPLLVNGSEVAMKLLQSTQKFVFDSMFAPIRRELASLDRKEDFSRASATVPKFSLTPQGYVKFIVEHLLVLRQVLEPYDEREGSNRTDSTTDEDVTATGFAMQWVSSISEATIVLFAEKIAQIPSLSPFGSAQLSVDIAHFFNVLKVLGIETSLSSLTKIQTLVSADSSDFQAVAERIGKEDAAVSLIARKRGLTVN
jgi:hypothetical protein